MWSECHSAYPTTELPIIHDYYLPDWEYYKMRVKFVICIQHEINKAKDYTFTLLAKVTI